MNIQLDISKQSLEELTSASRYIDREKYPDQYARVVQEIQRRGGTAPDSPAEKEAWAGPLPIMVRFFSHILGGFVFGLLVHIGYALIIAANTHAKVQAEPASMWQFIGLLSIPTASAIWGGVRAAQRPIDGLNHPLSIIGLLLLGTVGGILDLLIIFFTGMVGSSWPC